jgi:hypothetical protein
MSTCPPKYVLPKGTLSPNSGNVSGAVLQAVTAYKKTVTDKCGKMGPMGPPGLNGLDGIDGVTGPIGLGHTGPAGPTGPAGADGADGVDGATGPTGPSGTDGKTGPTGPNGMTGPTGASGTDGMTGPTGPSGTDGLPGPTGPSGTINFITGNNNIYIGTTGNIDDSNTVKIGNDDSVFFYMGHISMTSGTTGTTGTTGTYVITGTTGWIQLGQDIDGTNISENSAQTVSLSSDGTTIIIGSRSNGNDAGQARVYTFGSTGWIPLGNYIYGKYTGDQFGNNVSISEYGNIIAVNSALNNGASLGTCRIYQVGLTGGTTGWIQIGEDINGTNKLSSLSLSADGTTVAVGEEFNSDMGYQAGKCKIYQFGTTGWIQLGQDINGVTGDKLGYAVSLSGDGTIVAVGSPYNSENGTDSGKINIYQLGLTGGTTGWVKKETFNGDSGDYFGCSVSVSSDGTTVAVGALGNNTSTGKCSVYKDGTSGWIQVGSDINGINTGDQSGYSVSLSSDGTRLAIGAPKYETNNPGISIIYELGVTGGILDWIEIGQPIYGNINDELGFSISLSGDGTIVAIGSPQINDTLGYGKCSIYQLGLTGLTGTTGTTGITVTESYKNTMIDGTLILSDFITTTASSIPKSNQIGYKYLAKSIDGPILLGNTGYENINTSSYFTIPAGTWIVELSGYSGDHYGYISIGITTTENTADDDHTVSTNNMYAGPGMGGYMKMTSVIQQLSDTTWYIVGYGCNTNLYPNDPVNIYKLHVYCTRIA